MSEVITIAALDGFAGERVRVAIEEHRGAPVVDVRVMTQVTTTSGHWFATRKGLALPLAQIPELIRGLQAAHEKAGAMGLLGDD